MRLLRPDSARALCVLAALALAACGTAAPPPTPTPTPTPAPAPDPRPGDPGPGADARVSPDPRLDLPAPRPVTADEHAARRAALARAMDDGVLLVLGSPAPVADYLPFAQRSDFRYLTGITEQDAALVIEKRGGRVEERLFVQRRDAARETWEGRRLGAEGARALTGIEAEVSDRLVADLDARLGRHGRLYLLRPAPAEPEAGEFLDPEAQLVRALLRRHPGVQPRDLSEAIARLRARKSDTEIDLIRRAVHITVLAHREAARAVRPGMNEFEIQALIEYTFRRHGAESTAFESIVGSGPNSTTLHYRDADRFMRPGEVLLMDIGASYRGYAADVTRTIPVDGTFSDRQREIYEIVLEAQKAAERRLRPGATWVQLNTAAEQVLASGLARLGLIEDPEATYRCDSPRFGTTCPQYRLYYMHGLGHGIGLDVHDPDPSYFGRFEEGSTFTIEPGVYIRADALDHLPDTPENRAMIQRLRPALERYVDIGVRIEDDYLVTADGFIRLTEAAPREIDDIEALMREPARTGAPRTADIVEWYRATTVNR